MSNTNGQTVETSSAKQSTSPVATNAGTIVQVPDLNVPANRIAGFVAQYRKDYFEEHSLDWALDEIISRGMAEIKRQVKTAKKTAQNKASGDLLREFNLTPLQAKEILAQLEKQSKQAKSL